MDFLNRAASNLSEEMWSTIDESAVAAARDILTARRFLELQRPYEPGLTSIELGAGQICREPAQNEAAAIIGRAVSVPMLRMPCQVSARRMEAVDTMSQPLDLSPVEDAAEAVARREEQIIYSGEGAFGLEGLLTARASQKAKLGDWKQVEQALDDVLRAVDTLDGAGFHGPYALVASHALYNSLFRRYEGTDMLQLEHLKRLCELGVYKASIEGAAVIDPRVGDLIVGQDMVTGFAGNDGIHYQLYVIESLVLRLQERSAVCRLAAK